MPRPTIPGETRDREAVMPAAEPPSLLEYAGPEAPRRTSRLALFALQWSLFAPGLMVVLIGGTRDILDEIRPRWLMLAVFQVLVTAAPVTAVALGGIAMGHIRARQDELRGLWLAVAAVALGWFKTLGLSWLCWQVTR